MNFGQMKDQIRALAFPSGEQENLVAIHDAFFLEAIWEIQKAVPCLQIGNTDVYPHCATYFNCGLTVLPKPNGVITRIYVIDRINPDTGLEDASAIPDWCTKVFLSQVDYCNLLGYKRLCERCSGNTIAAVADAIATAFFGVFRQKRAYPKPTDEGFESLPVLPFGFKYPQTSTDAEGRSPSGVFALYRGKVHIAPWIQSTESVIQEWVGIKRNWSDLDLVEDDPKFLQAVRLHVQIQHEQSFGDDPGKLQRLKYALYGGPDEVGAIPLLIHECNEQNRIKRCAEAGASTDAARGMGANSASNNLFYNDRQEVTATCPAGQVGTPVTVVAEQGTVGSAISVADANARAYQQISEEAQNRLSCEIPAVTYFNTAQTATAHCPAADETTPAADGSPVTVTIAAGRYSSTVSQAAADAAALAAATAEAEANLTCTFWNAEKSFTAHCPLGSTGDDATETVAAHTHSSTVSQEDADALALAEAQQQANEALVCSTPPTVYYSEFTTQVASKTGFKHVGTQFCQLTVNVTVNLPAGRFSSVNSQAEANAQAASYALSNAQAQALNLYNVQTTCGTQSFTFNL